MLLETFKCTDLAKVELANVEGLLYLKALICWGIHTDKQDTPVFKPDQVFTWIDDCDLWHGGMFVSGWP